MYVERQFTSELHKFTYGKLKSWYVTFFYVSKQITFDLRGQGGQMELKSTKLTLSYLLKIRYVSPVGGLTPLYTLTFDLEGHWRPERK